MPNLRRTASKNSIISESQSSDASPPKENSAQKLVRMREKARRLDAEAERVKEELLEAERVVEQAKRKVLEAEREVERAEAEAKRKEEGRRKEEEKRKEEERRKVEEAEVKRKEDAVRRGLEKAMKKKAGVKKKASTTYLGRNVIHLEDNQSLVTKSKKEKQVSKSPIILNEAGEDISDDIVTGGLSGYPSCMACFKGNKECQWKVLVIHLRLSNFPNKAKGCENCIRKKGACQFIWERDESLKRTAESALEPESSKRAKVESSDYRNTTTLLESIEGNIGALVKLSAAQAATTTQKHQSDLKALRAIQTSLEGLHKKIRR